MEELFNYSKVKNTKNFIQIKPVISKDKRPDGWDRKEVEKIVNQQWKILKDDGFVGTMMVSVEYHDPEETGLTWNSSPYETNIQTEKPIIPLLTSRKHYRNGKVYTEEVEDPHNYRDFRIYVREFNENIEKKTKKKSKGKMTGGSVPKEFLDNVRKQKQKQKHNDDRTDDDDEEIQYEILKPYAREFTNKKHDFIICKLKRNKKYCDYLKDGKFYEDVKYDDETRNIIFNSEGYKPVFTDEPNCDDNKKAFIKNYDEFISKATDLKMCTEGKVDPFKTGNFTDTSKFQFYTRFMPKDIKFEKLTKKESEWLEKCNNDPIILQKDYKGKVYAYDANSFYPSIMKNKKFYVPYRRGRFAKKEYDGEIKGSVQYGIYRVIITCKDGIDPMLFSVNDENYYTSICVMRAIELGYSVKYVLDGDDNCLFYNCRTDCYNGDYIYGEYIKYFYKLKKNGVAGAGNLLQVFWGWQCTKSYVKNVIKGRIEDHVKIVGMIPDEDDDDKAVMNIKDKVEYKFGMARIQPFLKSMANLKLVNFYKDQLDDVVRVAIDGFIMKNKLYDEENLISKKIGCLKHDLKYHRKNLTIKSETKTGAKNISVIFN